MTFAARFCGAWIFVCLALAALVIDAANPPGFASDVDDRLRALQIKELLVDGQWHDLQINAVSMPEPYLSAWSRLVDAPYVGVTRFLQVFLAGEVAFDLSTQIVPVLLFFAFACGLIFSISLLLKRSPNPIEALMIFPVGLFAILEFAPGRIDHHNFQLVFLAWMVWALVCDHQKSGYWVGFLTLLSIAVGLEAIPFLVVVYCGLGLLSAGGHAKSIEKLQQAGTALVVVTLPVSYLLLGGTNVVAVHCDALSLPFICALIAGGFLLNLVTRLIWPKLQLSQDATMPALLLRLTVIVVPMLALLGILAVSFPVCTGGPYHMIDDVSRDFWLDRVGQERSFVFLARTQQTGVIIMFCLMISTFALATSKLIEDRSKQNSHVYILLALAFVSIVLALWQIRFYRFPALFCAVLAPVAFAMVRTNVSVDASLRRKIMTLTLLAAPFLVAIAMQALNSVSKLQPSEHTLMARDYCNDGDYSVLSDLPGGIIAAPSALSISLAESSHNQLQIAAFPTHRSSPGLRRIAGIFDDRHAIDRAKASLPFKYIAVCRHDFEVDEQDASLYRALVAGQEWPGLDLISLGKNGRFAIYKINHSEFH